MTVAVLGTGRMGAAMAVRLRERGADVVVHNRTRQRAAEVAARCGATVADTAAEAVAAAEVVLVSLADDAAVDAAYPELVAGVHSGTIIVDTSTVDPRTALRSAELVTKHGGAALDAPVSGSVPSVLAGTLAILAGGDAEVVDRALPTLELLASRVFHVGPAGAGATMKLAVNGVVHALNQAVSEALVLAETAGIARETAYDVLAASAAGAPFVAYKRAAFTDPDHTPVAFTLDLVGKDLDLILALADRLGLTLNQAATNREAITDALAAGHSGRDMSAMAGHLRSTRRVSRADT